MNRLVNVPDSAISNAEWLVETMKRLRTMPVSYERIHVLENAVYTAQLTYMILEIQHDAAGHRRGNSCEFGITEYGVMMARADKKSGTKSPSGGNISAKRSGCFGRKLGRQLRR